jgi:hypothetical protein
LVSSWARCSTSSLIELAGRRLAPDGRARAHEPAALDPPW